MTKRPLVLAGLLSIVAALTNVATASTKLSLTMQSAGEMIISVDPALHQDFGLSYPVTYKLSIPVGSTGLVAYRKHLEGASWAQLPEKTSGDYFNGEEVVRFDYAASAAYVSVAFDSTSDDIFLRVTDGAGQPVSVTFQNICRYYDNRQSAVTLTADDWKDYTDRAFIQSVHILRSYNLPVTVGIITSGCTPAIWQSIQSELDLGLVEAASHTRTHVEPPYPDPTGEIIGSKQDILTNLRMPPAFRKGSQGYVYTWIAPFGWSQPDMEALVSQGRYIIDRGIFASTGAFSAWSETDRRYVMDGKTAEMGPLWGGLTDAPSLNALFDQTLTGGTIYHLMMHPIVLADSNLWAKPDLRQHLDHISNRTNVWYVNFGTLYVYHLLQDDAAGTVEIAGGPPVVAAQPAPVSTTPGQTATFSVTARGGAPLSYQWQRNGVDIPGAVSAVYTTSTLTQADSGALFRCVISNSLGTVTSNDALLSILPANVLTNGSFESGTTPWNFYSNGSASFSQGSTGSSGMKSARISISTEGTNVQLYQAYITLQPNTEYRLSFDAYSSSGHDIEVSVGEHVSPYLNYGLNSRKCDLGTGWQSYAITFTTSGFSNTVSDARLMFWLAPYDAAGDVYNIDNVVLVRTADLIPVVVPPQITLEPVSQTVTAGQAATFSIAASGTAPLAYQWQKNNADIAGATGPSYTTAATTVADSGALYHCRVTNPGGSANSADAQLIVITPRPAKITAQPRDTTVQEGRGAEFSITAAGDAPLSYQWQKNGGDLAGATTPVYNIASAVRPDSGSTFRCIVTNFAGKDTSNAAVLHVLLAPPTITAQPTARTVALGQTASFTVRATGTAPLAYQWQKNGTDIEGATDTTYTTPATTAADSGALFRCLVSNIAGKDTSTEAQLIVSTIVPAMVAVDPRDSTIVEGKTATFTIVAAGTAPLTYRWQKNGLDISGAAQASYTTAAATFSDSGSVFRCIVSNSTGKDTSAAALLHVLPLPPAITTQPTSQSVFVGYTATFSVVAGSSAPLRYQWQKNDVSIPGAAGATYTTPATVPADSGAAFRCIVSNSGGPVASQAAILVVNKTTPAASNAVTNGTFESGTTGWNFYTSGAGSYATAGPGSSGSGSAMQLSVATEGTNVQLYQYGITLQPNTSYQLSFDAYSNTGHDVALSISQHVSPYTNYGLNSRAFNLTTGWQSFTVTFTTSGFSSTVSDARLWFWLAPYDASGDRFYFDNVQLAKTSDLTPLPPTITQNPTNQSVTAGQTASFSVSASGAAPLLYQWQKNGIDISGATGASYTTPATTAADSGALFRCRVTNSVTSVSSSAAQLLVNTPQLPIVTLEPRDTTVLDGGTAQFAVAASGSAPLTYQWQKNGVNISGATATVYSLSPAARGDSGATFRCVVSNSAGKDTSANARLVVLLAPPLITSQPANQSVTVGQTATFAVAATGSAPLTYQWQKNGSPITGATNATYTTSATAAVDSGSAFRCVVTNAAGSATSQAAMLSVTSVVQNQLTNGTFENGTTGWNFYTNGSGSYTAVTPGYSGTGRALQVAITTEGTNVQLYQFGISLQASTTYQLSFDAYSSSGHDLDVSVGQHGSPYTNYGLSSRLFNLTTSWQTYSVSFTTSGFSGSVNDARLMFWLASYDAAGDQYFIDNVVLWTSPAAIEAPEEEPLQPSLASLVPRDFVLEGNFPNPFNPSTVIRYGLPEPATVSIAVYSVLGQEVARLSEGYQSAGTFEVVWDGHGSSGVTLSSGIYLCRMVATGAGSGKAYVATKRMVLMK